MTANGMTATEIEYDMTTIRRQHREEGRRWPWIVLAIILLGVAAVVVFKPHGDSQIRGNADSGTTPPEKDQDIKPKEDTFAGRDITFEVSYLDGEDGQTDKFVVRTNPDWAPLGVEQFHVSGIQRYFSCCCTLLLLFVS